MKATSKFNNPDEIELTISVTATVGEWREIQKCFKEDLNYISPADRFRRIVTKNIDSFFSSITENLDSANNKL